MWVAEADWEYRRVFSVPSAVSKEAHVFLVCDELDTITEVLLNGTLLGRTDNMFRQYRWDVKSLLKSKGNEIWIRFPSTVCFAQSLQAKHKMIGVSQALEGGPQVRKAPSHFGWDGVRNSRRSASGARCACWAIRTRVLTTCTCDNSTSTAR